MPSYRVLRGDRAQALVEDGPAIGIFAEVSLRARGRGAPDGETENAT